MRKKDPERKQVVIVPLNLHPPREMDEFTRDLIFEKKAGSIELAAESN